MATRAEIEDLKRAWEADACWDLYDTAGFEEHREELKEHQEKMEKFWIERAREKARKKAELMGVDQDSTLFKYLNNLEHRIEQLENKNYGD
jgi:hypothetical protein